MIRLPIMFTTRVEAGNADSHREVERRDVWGRTLLRAVLRRTPVAPIAYGTRYVLRRVLKDPLDLPNGKDGLRNPREYEHEFSPTVKAAIVEAGGFDAVYEAVATMSDWMLPLTHSLFASRRNAFSRAFCVEGFEEVQQCYAEGRGVVVLDPHLGPMFALAGHLISRGIPVASTGIYDQAQSETLADTYKFWLGALDNGTPGKMIVAGRKTAGLEAFSALRNGWVLLWQPDVFGVLETSRHLTEVEFFGQTRRATTLVHRLLQRTGAALFVANARQHAPRHWSPAVTLCYERVDISPSLPAEEFLPMMYRAVENKILANIDQWARWEVYPNF
jgi:lauroyl/myristoyl acyltransferase